MLTQAWTPLRPHPQQARLWRTKARFVAVAAGRGSGKTEIARRRVVRWLSVKKPWGNPMYFYALPTMNQARRVAWDVILALVPPEWISDVNKSEMKITTVFGSVLYVMGMDQPQRAEGVQWDGGVIDESSDQKPKIFDLNILPALSHRNAWCWRIGVPKRFGVGAIEFREFCKKDAEEYYTWPSEDILTPEQLTYAQEHLDAVDYREQYLASWETAGGSIFHAFDEAANTSHEAQYDSTRPLVIGSDFNVDPMAWVIGHFWHDQRGLDIHDEIFDRDTNTPKTLDKIFRKYGQHPSGFLFYGDATGRARKTSAAVSDYAHILNDKRFKGARIIYPRYNPTVVDRFASTNALMCSASGVRRCRINPRCTNLIADLLARTWKDGVREADDYGDIGHITDALGYVIHYKFPATVVQQDGLTSVSV